MIIAITILAIAIATLVIGFALGVAYRKRSYEQALDVATQTATGIIETAKKEAAANATAPHRLYYYFFNVSSVVCFPP